MLTSTIKHILDIRTTHPVHRWITRRLVFPVSLNLRPQLRLPLPKDKKADLEQIVQPLSFRSTDCQSFLNQMT